MVLWLERHLNHKGIYARNEHKEGEAQRVLHHRCKYQLATKLLEALHQPIFHRCVDQCNARSTSLNQPIEALYLFHDDP